MASASELRRLKQRSYLGGVSLFLFDVFCYGMAIVGTSAAPRLGTRIACGILAGFWTSGLVVIGHDACHHSLTPNRKLNRILGTLAFLPALHAYSLWKYGHNHLHHLFTNVRGYDYVWEPLSPPEYRALSWWGQFRYRFFRTYPGHFFYYTCEVWIRRRFIPRQKYLDQIRPQHWLDFGFVVLWLALLTVGSVMLRRYFTGQAFETPLSWLGPIAVSVVLPFVTSGMLMSDSEYLHHTHPRIHWYTSPPSGNWMERQSKTAVHCQFSKPADWLMHWIMDHTAHHMQPSIPCYHLSQAQQSVEAESPEAVVAYRWKLGTVLSIMRTCKLYDNVLGCWTDYEGNPTSESRLGDDALQRAA